MAKILIVDDELHMREMLKKMLRKTTHEITTAEDGKSALKLTVTTAFDLAIIDLRMPKISGEALIEAIRQTNKQISLIVLTGHGNLETAGTLLEQFQIADFLSKPLQSPSQLLFAVKNALSRQALHKKITLQMKKLETMAIRANAANHSKDEFLSTISHELKTPLTSINLALDLLRDGTDPQGDELVAEALGIAQRNTNKLQLLINSLLDYQALTSNSLQFSMTETDLQATLRAAIAESASYAQQSKVTFVLTGATNESISCDPSRLQQVACNLLSNAAKFSPPGGNVCIQISQEGDYLQFSVTDEGPGIAPEHHHKVFEHFSQIDQSDARPSEGTGLGLSISRKLVEAMNGRIGLDSQLGRGSTFWVQFPILPQ